MGRLSSLWRNLVHRRRVDRDLDEELAAAYDLLVEEKVRSGMPVDDARRAARLELGSPDTLKDQVRDVRAGAGLDALGQDVRYSLRQFRRAPGFAAVAVVTLALGIGANAAVFGVVKSVLLDALPYAEADRLVRVRPYFLDGAPGSPLLFSRMVHTIASRQQSFESLAAFDSARDAVLGGEDSPRIVTIAWVEPGLFKTLGVQAALGRTFHDEDRAIGHVPVSGGERGPDTARVVVLAHEAWQGLFAGDPGIVGRDVRINGIPRTVIGVLPRGFVGLRGQADFYFAFDLAPALTSGAGWLGLVGRLKPGTTHEAARRELAAIWAAREYPQDFDRLGMTAMPLRDAMVGSTRAPLLVLLASAALVLLIACANLAGVQLSRALRRRKEFAVRVALGAGRRRLVRQLLTESTLLALAGGGAGLLLAQWLLSLLRGLARPVLPAHAELSLDPGAVLGMAVLAVSAGLAFGVAPALSVGGWDAQGLLRDQARGASEARRPRRLRGVLVAAQIALCASLLAGAGLLARSLWEMVAAPLGFDPPGLLTAKVRLPTREYPTLESRARFQEQLADRLRALPGVEAVAMANKLPTAEDPRHDGLSIEGAPPDAAPPFVAYASVSDDYFRTLRIPVRQGRAFDASDRSDGPPTAGGPGDGRRRRRLRAQRPRPARRRADDVSLPRSGINPNGVRPAPRARRPPRPRETPPAGGGGPRLLPARPAGHDPGGGGRRRARLSAASAPADRRVFRPGPAPLLGRRLRHVRQPGGRPGAGVRRSHRARLAAGRHRRAHAAAGRRMDGRRPSGRRARHRPGGAASARLALWRPAVRPHRPGRRHRCPRGLRDGRPAHPGPPRHSGGPGARAPRRIGRLWRPHPATSSLLDSLLCGEPS